MVAARGQQRRDSCRHIHGDVYDHGCTVRAHSEHELTGTWGRAASSCLARG